MVDFYYLGRFEVISTYLLYYPVMEQWAHLCGTGLQTHMGGEKEMTNKKQSGTCRHAQQEGVGKNPSDMDQLFLLQLWGMLL